VLNIIPVDPGKITFSETQIVDRIQQIGFPHAVLSAYTHDPFREIESSVNIILELKKANGPER
jgi:hypothetical protein